jgi:ubiquinone/menaquinone biosynthesis C-methylase UbiE
MTTPQRNDAYAIEMSPAELDRLVILGELLNPFVLDGFRRTTIGPGDKVIDVGCGAVGALRVLADLVGSQGTVVGLDMDERSLGHARFILNQQGHQQVQLVHGNINELDPASLCPPGPFDAAFCRAFLIHQTDPVATLRRMAKLVRPGGYIVAHELLFNGMHQSVPEVPALNATLDLWARTMRARGASPDVSTRFSSVCAATGLHEVDQHGWFANRATMAPVALSHARATTLSFRNAIIETGVATAAEVDALNQELVAAEHLHFDLLANYDYMELVAQVPETA